MKFMMKTPWHNYDNPTDMVLKNQVAFEAVGKELSQALNLKFEQINDRYSFGTCSVGDENGSQEGYSLTFFYRDFIDEEHIKAAKSVFPMTIGHITFNFLTVFDYDYDDERDFMPSVGFSAQESNSKAVVSDHVFLYW